MYEVRLAWAVLLRLRCLCADRRNYWEQDNFYNQPLLLSWGNISKVGWALAHAVMLNITHEASHDKE